MIELTQVPVNDEKEIEVRLALIPKGIEHEAVIARYDPADSLCIVDFGQDRREPIISPRVLGELSFLYNVLERADDPEELPIVHDRWTSKGAIRLINTQQPDGNIHSYRIQIDQREVGILDRINRDNFTYRERFMLALAVLIKGGRR